MSHATVTTAGSHRGGAAPPRVCARRLVAAPIVTAQTPGLTPVTGRNICGPSAIRVPDWIDPAARLGRYYLYFAHHQGRHIRLAYADAVTGPWRVHAAGTLRIEQTPFGHHIASPDVHVDHARRRLVMYYHGARVRDPRQRWEQPTCVAYSQDGLRWASDNRFLGESYFRVFGWRGTTYAISKEGRLYRSADGVGGFEQRARELDYSGRHWAAWLDEHDGDLLHVVYSRWGDAPERLLHAVVPLSQDWWRWELIGRRELLRPEHDWEGADEPVGVAVRGSRPRRLPERRDPAVLRDTDGRRYLFYTVAGESGIAVAELRITNGNHGHEQA